MKKVLIFKTSEMAYESTRIFADELGRELTISGCQVEYFDVKKDSKEVLEKLPQNQYDFIVDFNSAIPQLIIDDSGMDEYFLDTFQCPFVNYILDHPMYHHKNLVVPLKQYDVICIDDTHEQYIKECYPNIQDVITAPLGYVSLEKNDEDYQLSKDNFNQWENRRNRVLFTGTYLNPDDYMEMINDLPEPMKSDNLKVIDGMFRHVDETFEDIVEQILGVKRDSKHFPIRVQSVCFADIYVRAYFRKKALESLVHAHVPLTIYGEKYDQAKFLYKADTDVEVFSQVNYQQSVDLMKEYQYVLNVQPWFKSGIHDRVINGIHQGCIVITDSSKRMDKDYKDGEQYISFELRHMEELGHKVVSYIKDENKGRNMINHHVQISEKYTFKKIAEQILSLV